MKNKSYPKMVVIFALILVITTSLWFALPATLCYAQGGYGVVDIGGAGNSPPPSLTLLGNNIDAKGVLTNDLTAKSPDAVCQLTISKGTEALDKSGDRLTGIIMVATKEPPEPPADSTIIGLIYDLEPDGVTFDPPITLTFTYNQNDVPKGADEKDLTICYYDEGAGTWGPLEDTTIDSQRNIISAPISHFTGFAVIASTRPAAFTASDLSITPAEVGIAEEVNISATVSNAGDLAGTQEVTLKVNGEAVSTKSVTVDGRTSEKVIFISIQGKAGTYAVDVNGLSGTFTVKSPPPIAIPAPPTPAPAPTPAPTPTPALPAPAPPTPAPAPEANVWLLVIIAAATIIVVGGVIWFWDNLDTSQYSKPAAARLPY
jgi:hypothetical protein